MHTQMKIPAKTCPRCLGDRKQQPQNCGVCQGCYGIGEVPAHELTVITSLAKGYAVRSWARRNLYGFVPNLFSGVDFMSAGDSLVRGKVLTPKLADVA